MIDRSHIEKILEINGVSAAEPDDNIRSVLLSARYDKDEIDTALMVLREDAETKQIRVEGLHKVFRSDEALRPKEISLLLGVDVDASRFQPVGTAVQPKVDVYTFFGVWIFSVLFAVSGILTYMYMNGIGFFHPSMVM